MQSDYLLVMYVGGGGLYTYITVDVRLPLYLHLTRQKNSKCKKTKMLWRDLLLRQAGYFVARHVKIILVQILDLTPMSLFILLRVMRHYMMLLMFSHLNNEQLKEDAFDGSNAWSFLFSKLCVGKN